MGRSRASREQMGMTDGVVPCKKNQYAMGEKIKPVVAKAKGPLLRNKNDMAMRNRGEKSQ